jgi:hypothetical protein
VRDIVKAYYDKKQGKVPDELNSQARPAGAPSAASVAVSLPVGSASLASRSDSQKTDSKP